MKTAALELKFTLVDKHMSAIDAFASIGNRLQHNICVLAISWYAIVHESCLGGLILSYLMRPSKNSLFRDYSKITVCEGHIGSCNLNTRYSLYYEISANTIYKCLHKFSFLFFFCFSLFWRGILHTLQITYESHDVTAILPEWKLSVRGFIRLKANFILF